MSDNLFVLTGQEEDTVDPTEWGHGLPEFIQDDNEAPYIIVARFRNLADRNEFCDKIGQPEVKLKEGHPKSQYAHKSIWFPKLVPGERGMSILYSWEEEESQ